MIIAKIRAKLSRPNPALKMKIEELGFTTRTYAKLKRAGINTVSELTDMTWDDLARERGMVRNSIEEVERLLAGVGLKLKEGE